MTEPSSAAALVAALTAPQRLYTRDDALASPSPIPDGNGIYGWYFDPVPAGVPAGGCHAWQGRTMLYVGVADGRAGAHGLRGRIRRHFGATASANASRSTLRLTLGCLLADHLSLRLGWWTSGRAKPRLTWLDGGEQRLSDWMATHAVVCAVPAHLETMDERHVIALLDLPLNLQHNGGHPFHVELDRLRRDHRSRCGRPPTGPRWLV